MDSKVTAKGHLGGRVCATTYDVPEIRVDGHRIPDQERRQIEEKGTAHLNIEDQILIRVRPNSCVLVEFPF